MSRNASILVERLGLANAIQLAKAAGGTRIGVPTSLTGFRHHSDALQLRVGEELASLLVKHFGGTRIYVPRMAPRPPVDTRLVIRLTKRGWSASRIARKLGCSDRTVHAKRAAFARANPQETK
jgi:hypothetical protein